MQIRQAAATARKALIDLAAQRLNVKAEDLVVADGEVRPKAGGAGVSFADLIGGRQFDLKLDPKAPLKDPAELHAWSANRCRGPTCRPNAPARHVYMQDFTVPGMLHARVIRPPAIGATLLSVDESSIKELPGAKVVRIKDFLAVVAEDEWTAVRAARALQGAMERLARACLRRTTLPRRCAPIPASPTRRWSTRATAGTPRPRAPRRCTATYFWPMQSHASIGPSCAVADVSADGATVWTASQGTHGNRNTFARFLGLPRDKVRLIYLEGSGCYGMNGHEDAAADAAILSRAVGRPVRVQWSREDELGWDPKGPPQLIDISGAVDRRRPHPRLEDRDVDSAGDARAAQYSAAGAARPPASSNVRGLNAGLISQNGDPPYAADSIQVVAHWLKDAPLRPAPIRSPGKPANCFAVESFVDELAAAARHRSRSSSGCAG